MHSWNASAPIFLTLLGIVIYFNPHPQKHLSPMVCSLLPATNVTWQRHSQPKNAIVPSSRTLADTVTLSILDSMNQSLLTLVTPSGSTTLCSTRSSHGYFPRILSRGTGRTVTELATCYQTVV